MTTAAKVKMINRTNILGLHLKIIIITTVRIDTIKIINALQIKIKILKLMKTEEALAKYILMLQEKTLPVIEKMLDVLMMKIKD